MAKIEDKLLELIESPNIVEMLDDNELGTIAEEVLQGFEEDKQSMGEWLDKADEIMKLANLPQEEKHWPWPKASNVKYPLLTMAVIQFGSRTLPEFARNGKIVKYKVIGRDPEGIKNRKGQRSADYMNYKLIDESPTWWNDHDKLLHTVAAVGTAFVKSCYDPLTGQVRSDVQHYKDVIVNNDIKSLPDAPRISHRVCLTKNDLIQGMRSEIYAEHDPEMFVSTNEDKQVDIEFIEQHVWLDLDDDGYAEPYIVLIHPDTMTVLRIVANYRVENVQFNAKGNKVVRIDKKYQYFTSYHFLPNPDGSFFSNGFGTLLLSLNNATNTILNQLVDAGTLANTQGGFIGKGLRIRKDNMEIQPGEWVHVETNYAKRIQDEVYQLNYKEPSSVLFSLLGMIISATKELTSTTEVMLGDIETQNTSPNTMNQAVQQGMTVYLAIQRRIFIGLKQELKEIYKLYGEYGDPQDYLRVLDLTEAETQEMLMEGQGTIADFKEEDADLLPVAEFNNSTEVQRGLKAQNLMNMAIQAGGVFNMPEVMIEVLKAQGFENPERFLAPPQQGPSIQEIALQADQQEKQGKLQIAAEKLNIDRQKLQIDQLKAESAAIKDLATAESLEAGTQLDRFEAQKDTLLKDIETEERKQKLTLEERRLDIEEDRLDKTV